MSQRPSSYAVQKIIERATSAVENSGYRVTGEEVLPGDVIHLDVEPVSSTGRSVYFLQGKRTKLVKIGVANNVKSRMRDIQNMSPDKLILLAALPGAATDEAELHGILRTSRVWGEWFVAGTWLIAVMKCAREQKDAKALIEMLGAK